MIFEYAFSPGVFEQAITSYPGNIGCTNLVEILDQVSQNGLVANLCNGKWISYIYNDVTLGMDNDQKDSVKSLIKKLIDRNLLVNRPDYGLKQPSNYDDWDRHIIYDHNQSPFDVMFFKRGTPLTQPEMVEFPPAPGSKWHSVKMRRDRKVEKTLTAYEEVLSPLLQYAEQLSMIDPYANPYESRYTDPIKLFSRLLGKKLDGQGEIYIYTGNYSYKVKDEISGKDIECHKEYDDVRIQAWSNLFEECYSCHKHNYQVSILKRKKGSPQKFHNRYLLTERFGIQIPSGYDSAIDEGSKEVWSILDEELKGYLEQSFRDNSHYNLIRSTHIP